MIDQRPDFLKLNELLIQSVRSGYGDTLQTPRERSLVDSAAALTLVKFTKLLEQSGVVIGDETIQAITALLDAQVPGEAGSDLPMKSPTHEGEE